MITSLIFGSAIGYISYEIAVGIQVVREVIQESKEEKFSEQWHETYGWEIEIPQEQYPNLYKVPYIPPTIAFRYVRQDYLDWKEWKGERFKK